MRDGDDLASNPSIPCPSTAYKGPYNGPCRARSAVLGDSMHITRDCSAPCRDQLTVGRCLPATCAGSPNRYMIRDHWRQSCSSRRPRRNAWQLVWRRACTMRAFLAGPTVANGAKLSCTSRRTTMLNLAVLLRPGTSRKVECPSPQATTSSAAQFSSASALLLRCNSSLALSTQSSWTSTSLSRS
jgi:hypothetical protein